MFLTQSRIHREVERPSAMKIFKKCRKCMLQLTAVLSLSVFSTVANAQQADFVGTGVLSDFSETCLANGWGGPAIVKARYRPAAVGSNGTDGRLSFFFDTFASGFRVRGSGFDNTFRSTEATYVGSAGFSGIPAQIRITAQRPANLRANTRFADVTFRILDYDDQEGCDLTLETRLTLRPW